MRTIIDIPKNQISQLDEIGQRDKLPRAELVRRAIDLYLGEERKKKSDKSLDTYFGFLKDTPEAFDGLDGLDYQDKMRSEWDQRDQDYGRWGFQEREEGGFQHGSLPDLNDGGKGKA